VRQDASIAYVVGDATRPEGSGPRVIVHVCNDSGGWGWGFVLVLSRAYPEAERRYRAWHARGEDDGAPFALGQAQFAPVAPDLWVANLIGQHGTRRAGTPEPPPVRYEAIRQGLARVASFALGHGASVHMPRIGTGLAGGEWTEIEPIVREELTRVHLKIVGSDLRLRSHGSVRTLRCQNGAGGSVAATHTRPQSAPG